MDIKQSLLEIFIERLGVGLEEITPETTNNDLSMDSLDKVEIVMDIESEFRISITDNEMNALKQFKDYVAVVERKLA
jgi:acyl carrier protein